MNILKTEQFEWKSIFLKFEIWKKSKKRGVNLWGIK